MKVTAILPDDLIKNLKQLSHGKNITDSLKIALNDWVKIQTLKKLNREISSTPLEFEYTADEIRSINRL